MTPATMIATAGVRVLSLAQRDEWLEWDDLVTRSPDGDVYYRPGYVRAHEAAGHGTAVGVIVSAAGSEYLFPLLLRPVSDLPFAAGDIRLDAVTPYGYGGMLRLNGAGTTAEQALAVRSLSQWCCRNGVVSALLRLHPMRKQEADFAEMASAVPGLGIHPFGPTTAIDASEWDDVNARVAGMNENRRRNLANARKHLEVTCVEFESGAAPSGDPARQLDLFYDIYEWTMTRLNSSAFYHFPRSYYYDLAAGLGGDMALVLTWHKGEAAGGAIFMKSKTAAHYHLGGGNELARQFGSSTMVMNEGARWSRSHGCGLLHLGGGAGGDDALFEFKKSFGGPVFHYGFGTLIADSAAYDQLVGLRRQHSNAPLRANFFPEYRA